MLRILSGVVAILAAALVSALTIAFLLPPQHEGPTYELLRFVDSMPYASYLEMCEVWSQDQQAVIDRLQVLSYDINPGIIRAVVSQTCYGEM